MEARAARTADGSGFLAIYLAGVVIGNRRLVFQASKGFDWWLHLRDRPSAHAVLSFGRDVAWLWNSAQLRPLDDRIGAAAFDSAADDPQNVLQPAGAGAGRAR